jgi:hypothetical protein
VGVGYPGLRFAPPRAKGVSRFAAKGTRPSDEASLETCHPEETMRVCTPTISESASAIVVHARGACEGSTKRVGCANMHHDGVAKRDLSWAWMRRVARTRLTREVVGCTMQANRACVGVGYPGLRFAPPRAKGVSRSAAKGTRPSDEASLETCHPEETMRVCTPTISESASAIVVYARGACEGSTKRVGCANMHLFMKAGTASRSATCRGRG